MIIIGLEYILQEFKTNANQLATDLGISRFTVYDWLKERRKIPEKRLEELSKLFKLPKEYFISNELKPSEKIAIQKAYIDQNATFIEYQDFFTDEDGNVHEVTRYHSPEQDLSQHLSYVQRANELIEKIQQLINFEVSNRDDYYQNIFRMVMQLVEKRDHKKIKMLHDVLDFLIHADSGFMVHDDKKKEEVLQELFNLYHK